MLSIQKIPVSVNTMLGKYSSVTGAYTDCYVTEIAHAVSFREFVFAFYTTPLFKLERLILLIVSKPSTDAQARQIADGKIEKFAAWTVEARTENELLMCDFLNRTCSWFMVKSLNGSRTRLHFGSAIVPQAGKSSLEFEFRALLKFHQLYSVLLLYSAKQKIIHSQGDSK